MMKYPTLRDILEPEELHRAIQYRQVRVDVEVKKLTWLELANMVNVLEELRRIKVETYDANKFVMATVINVLSDRLMNHKPPFETPQAIKLF